MTRAKKRLGTKKRPTGPEPERVKLTGDWKASVKMALAKKRPKKGWPKE